MDVPSPLEPGWLQGSSRAAARLLALSLTCKAAGADVVFQLTRGIPNEVGRRRPSFAVLARMQKSRSRWRPRETPEPSLADAVRLPYNAPDASTPRMA